MHAPMARLQEVLVDMGLWFTSQTFRCSAIYNKPRVKHVIWWLNTTSQVVKTESGKAQICHVSTLMSKQWKEFSERYFSDLLDKLESPSQPTLVGMSFFFEIYGGNMNLSAQNSDICHLHILSNGSASGVPPPVWPRCRASWVHPPLRVTRRP